jgi:hypothetical protein
MCCSAADTGAHNNSTTSTAFHITLQGKFNRNHLPNLNYPVQTLQLNYRHDQNDVTPSDSHELQEDNHNRNHVLIFTAPNSATYFFVASAAPDNNLDFAQLP